MQTVYTRMFHHLADLVPNVAVYPEGASFYAPPRIVDDMSLFCSIVRQGHQVTEIEIAHDQVKEGTTEAAPWMVFRIDHAEGTANLLQFQEAYNYDAIHGHSDTCAPRGANLNVFAVNWLNVLVNMRFVFAPVTSMSVSVFEEA